MINHFMHYMVCGGTGFISGTLVAHFLSQGHTVTVVGRSISTIRNRFQNTVNALTWQVLCAEHLCDIDAVFVLTGVPLSRPWTKKFKQKCVDARINPAKQMIALCEQLPVKKQQTMRLFFASGVGIYGGGDGQGLSASPLTEKQTPPQDNARFSMMLVRHMEAITQPAKVLGMSVVNLRFGVVLSMNNGLLAIMKWPFLLGVGAYFGRGQQPFPWVHINDVINSIDFLLATPSIVGPVNIVSPQQVSNKQFSKALAKRLHRPCWFSIPAFILVMLGGQMAKELLLHGPSVYPAKLLEAGFVFHYDTLKKALI